MNSLAGGESGALSNNTACFYPFDSLVNFPLFPALSSQTYMKHALLSITGSVSFWGQIPSYQLAKVHVGKTYSN